MRLKKHRSYSISYLLEFEKITCECGETWTCPNEGASPPPNQQLWAKWFIHVVNIENTRQRPRKKL